MGSRIKYNQHIDNYIDYWNTLYAYTILKRWLYYDYGSEEMEYILEDYKDTDTYDWYYSYKNKT